jgi:hypothetical protein
MHIFSAKGLVAPDPIPETGQQESLFAEGSISAGLSRPISKPNGSSCGGTSLERFAKHLDPNTLN